MKITITGCRKVADIQQEFNFLYPFLNLEFFDLSDNELATYVSAGKQYAESKVKDLRIMEKDGILEIQDNMTIMQLENLLSDEFGLDAQVFVKHGDQWMRSSLNGYWMLFYKNEEGRRTAFPYLLNN